MDMSVDTSHDEFPAAREYKSAEFVSAEDKELDFNRIHGKLLAWQARGSVDEILRPLSWIASPPLPSVSHYIIKDLEWAYPDMVEKYAEASSMLTELRFVFRLEHIKPLLGVYDSLWEAFFKRHTKLSSLRGDKNLQKGGFGKKIPHSPLLAGSTSELAQNILDNGSPPEAEDIEEEGKRQAAFSGGAEALRLRQQQQEREKEVIDTIYDEFTRSGHRTYAHESWELTKDRAADDRDRDFSPTRLLSPWTEDSQRALEYQRVENDYLRLKEKLFNWRAGDNYDNVPEETLRLRLRYIMELLRHYDTLWKTSSRRCQQAKERQPQQRIPGPTEQGMDRCNDEEQNANYDNEDNQARGLPRRGQPKIKRARFTSDSESQKTGDEITAAAGRDLDPVRCGRPKTKHVVSTSSKVHPGKVMKSSKSRKSPKPRLRSVSISTTPRRSTRVVGRAPA
ncbi:hypothetical protein MMC30_000826 [Trapelia coarctata]|nr:hypothetical protein [Trapelia coarctata]